MFMVLTSWLRVIAWVHLFYAINAEQRQMAADFWIKPTDVKHPLSTFVITQPESWYSFYQPTEGRRLSRPRWLVAYPEGLPAHKQWPIQVVTGSIVD